MSAVRRDSCFHKCNSSMLFTQSMGICSKPRAYLRRRRRALTLDYDTITLSDSCFSYHLHMPGSAFSASIQQSVKAVNQGAQSR